jgi:hypothetical protein
MALRKTQNIDKNEQIGMHIDALAILKALVNGNWYD